MAFLPVMAAISLGATALGGIMSGQAQAQAAGYKAQIAERNAEIAKQNATLALQIGQSQSQDQAQKDNAHLGRVKAVQGASGLQVNSGSLADVYEGQEANAATDQFRISQDSTQRAKNYANQSNDFSSEAQLERAQKRNVQTSSLIDTVGAVSGKFAGYRQVGTL